MVDKFQKLIVCFPIAFMHITLGTKSHYVIFVAICNDDMLELMMI